MNDLKCLLHFYGFARITLSSGLEGHGPYKFGVQFQPQVARVTGYFSSVLVCKGKMDCRFEDSIREITASKQFGLAMCGQTQAIILKLVQPPLQSYTTHLVYYASGLS